MAMYKKYKYLRAKTKAKAFACPKCISTIEVILYRVMMNANPLLIVQAMCAYFAHFLAKSAYILCTCVNPILPEDKDHEDEPDDDD